jgi:ABC-type multidrug transport system fused ATPase/permease subunit
MTPPSLVVRIIRRYLPPGSGVLFTSPTRRRFVVVLIGSLLMAMIELLGMACLLLLMLQLTDIGTDSAVLVRVSELLGTPRPQTMLIYLASAVFVVFAAKAVFGLLFRRWMLLFVATQEVETSYRLLIGYLHGPYWRVLQRSTGDLVRSIYDSTSAVYGGVVGPIIQLGVEGLTVAAVLAFLLVAMPIPTLAAFALFGTATWVMNRYVKDWARRVGEVQVATGGQSWRATLQALSGIKEIRVRRTEDHFLKVYYEARSEWGRARATSGLIGELPKYVLEVFFIAGVLLVVGLVSITSGAGQTLPLIALFVASGLRLLPSAVRILSAINAIRVNLPHMEIVVHELLSDLSASTAWLSRDVAAGRPRLTMQDHIEIRDVSFRYPTSEADVIDGVSLRIPAGQAVAFAGSSGAGKSTLVDLVLGLHQPSSGQILADGIDVQTDIAAWQRSVGLVPQDVLLLDESLSDNVTLGLDLDRARLDAVLAQAQLSELVASLPDGVDTTLGERGSRVSGGQRQRIGIARALYAEPSVLILDEATSALDNETERRITETIAGLRGTVTTIVVAHRLSTIRECDSVIFLEGGRVASQGTFDEVADSHPAFAQLVALGRL